MTIKHTIQILVGTCIVLMFTVIMAKYLVFPIKNSISSKAIKIAELESAKIKLTEQVVGAKEMALDELDLEEQMKLIKYINDHTSVLTDSMINDSVRTLVSASRKNNIPVELLVAIAQATSNFNTTYLSASGHRGILALNRSYWETGDTVKNVNKLSVGVSTGAAALKVLQKTYVSQEELLIAYFGDVDYFRAHEKRIYRALLEYLMYKK